MLSSFCIVEAIAHIIGVFDLEGSAETMGLPRSLRFLLVFLCLTSNAQGTENLKTDISPSELNLKLGVVIDSEKEFKRSLLSSRLKQALVSYERTNNVSPGSSGKEDFWNLSISLPQACGLVQDLLTEGTALNNNVQIASQISFNDLIASKTYCSRYTFVRSGSKSFIEDHVSQESVSSLTLKDLGYDVEVANPSSCVLVDGRYSFKQGQGQVDCLNEGLYEWYYISIYDHVFRDMNKDGYLDLIVFTTLNGPWSGPPNRSTLVLTKTSPIENWRLLDSSTWSMAPGGEDGTGEGTTESIDDFKYLDEFKTVREFDEYIEGNVESCIDETYGGTAAIPCFIGYELWDRELNKYYNLLVTELPKDSVKLLRESQRLWLRDRDKTIELNSALLDLRYKEVQGTIYSAMRANDADRAIVPVVRQRALFLKLLYERELQGAFGN